MRRVDCLAGPKCHPVKHIQTITDASHDFFVAEPVLLSREAQLALLHSGHPPRRNCFDRGQPLSWSSRYLRGSHLGERRGEGGREGEREREKHSTLT